MPRTRCVPCRSWPLAWCRRARAPRCWMPCRWSRGLVPSPLLRLSPTTRRSLEGHAVGYLWTGLGIFKIGRRGHIELSRVHIFARELFNSKAGAVTFDMALKHPSFKTKEETLDQNALSKVYSVFIQDTKHTSTKYVYRSKSIRRKKFKEKSTVYLNRLRPPDHPSKTRGTNLERCWSLYVHNGHTWLRRTREVQTWKEQMSKRLTVRRYWVFLAFYIWLGSSKLFDRLILIETGEGKSAALGWHPFCSPC